MSQEPDDKFRESHRELKELVYSLLDKVRSSPALNGGFTKLQDTVAEIKEYQIRGAAGMEHLHVITTETKEKVEEIHQTMYDPHTGLFTRLGTVERDGEDVVKTIDGLKEDTGRHSLAVKKNEEKLRELEDQADDLAKNFETHSVTLKKIAGDDYSDLKDLVRIKRNLNRVFWAVGLAFFAAFGKATWDLVMYLQGLFANQQPPGH